MERIMLNICIVLNDTHYCVKQHLQNLLMTKYWSLVVISDSRTGIETALGKVNLSV